MYDNMSSRINARLDDELARKLAELCRTSGQSTSAILKAALEAYIASAQARSGAQPGLLLQRAGFIGCARGPAGLSQSYKEALGKSLRDKT
jgi:predicted transcriptional regulator